MGIEFNASGYGDNLLQAPVFQENIAKSQLAGTEAQQAAAEEPTNVEAAQTKLAQDKTALAQGQTALGSSQLDLQNKTAEQPIVQMRTWEARLAQAAASIQPDDPKGAQKWAAIVQKETAAGNPLAEQWPDWSSGMQSRLVEGYSAASPVAQQSALGGSPFQSALAGPNGYAPGQTPPGGAPTAPMNWEANFADKPVQELQQNLQHLDTIKMGLQAVANSPNPAAEWDRQMRANGVPNPPPYSPQAWNTLAQQVVPMDDALRAHLSRAALGAPQTQVAPKIENVGGAVVSTDPTNPGGVATPLYEPNKFAVDPYGKGPHGEPIALNQRTGAFALGPAGSEQMQRGGGATAVREQVADQMGLTGQAKLDYIGGQKAPNPQTEALGKIRAATAMRDADINAAVNAGKPITSVPPLTAYEQQVDQAMGTTPAAGGAPGATAPAPKGWTGPQWTTAQQFKQNAGQPPGTQANPRAPLNKAQYDGLPKGTWYVDPNGSVFQKK